MSFAKALERLAMEADAETGFIGNTHISSAQDFDRQVGEGTKSGIGREKDARTVFDSCGKLEGIHRFEIVRGSDAGSPIADGCGDGHDLHIGPNEESMEAGLHRRIVGFQRPDKTLHPGQVANHERVSRRLGGGKAE
jgi:hypothetical protein